MPYDKKYQIILCIYNVNILGHPVFIWIHWSVMTTVKQQLKRNIYLYKWIKNLNFILNIPLALSEYK